MIINQNHSDQRRYILKQRRASVRDDIINQAYNDAESSLAAGNNEVATTESEPTRKKRRSVFKQEFKKLDKAEQLRKMKELYGVGGVLDFTKRGSIPKMLATDVRALKETYSLNFQYYLQKEEHALLKKIANCRDKECLYEAIKDVDPFTKSSALPYIKQAVQKLCYLYNDNLLERGEHNEDWYRIMVYGDLFDYLFATKDGYITKRSECHSKIIKSLKELNLLQADEPNVKLDFIFCNKTVSGINDALICEDKPTETESTKDIQKNRKLREKSLLYWSSILRCLNALEHLTSTPCRFNKLNLDITITKIINGIVTHTTVKEISIPVSARSGAMISHFLAFIISLMRSVVKNIDTIETIIQVIQEDNMNFLAGDDSFLYESDSDASSSGTSSSTYSTSLSDWQAAERKERIKARVNEAISLLNERYQIEHVPTSWESNAFNDDD